MACDNSIGTTKGVVRRVSYAQDNYVTHFRYAVWLQIGDATIQLLTDSVYVVGDSINIVTIKH